MRISQIFIVISLFLTSGLALTSTTNESLDRLEPPFWWAGMVNNQLQLMAYDSDFMIRNVISSSDDVMVESIEHSSNKHYAFINLSFSSSLKPSVVQLTFEQEDGSSIIKNYEFKKRIRASAERQGFSSKDVIYLVTPDRFANGDPSNDSMPGLSEEPDRGNPGGRHGGDLLGLQQHLDYLFDLGVSKVWLNPLQQNNESHYSYHGYSISDLYQVDARYGGNKALLDFSNAAKLKGIGLIMDTIPNHIGINHWWLADLPSEDWLNNGGEFKQTSHNHESVQDPYVSKSDQSEFNDGWFVATMPDLNQRNKKLANYLIQNNIWWIEYADLAGLRVDTLPYADKYFTAEFNQRILNEYPNLNIVGEEWTTNPAIVSYWQAGKKNQDGFDAGVPSLMDFPLQDALINALLESEVGVNGLRRLHTMLANDFQYPDPQNLVVIGDNHDMSRLHTQLNEDPALTKMALTFLMTTRGIPQLFYGTEILMSNKGSDDHGVIRSDFPGGWFGDSVNARTTKGLSNGALDMQGFVKKLLNWRKTSSAIHSGNLVHYLPKDGVYAYFRSSGNEQVMVLMNNNDSSSLVDLSRFQIELNDHKTLHNILYEKTMLIPTAMPVPAKTALIFELK